jgi:hypothetical protein
VLKDLARWVAVSGDAGIAACDNDHNTDTERHIFFVKMT